MADDISTKNAIAATGVGLPTAQEQTISSWAAPYVTGMLGRAEALSQAPYQAYTGQLTAGPSDLQSQAFSGLAGLTIPSDVTQAAQTASNVAARAGQYGYTPAGFGNVYQAPGAYTPGQIGAQNVIAPNLQQYQMGPAQQVTTQTFAQPDAASAYMSPYMQNVVAQQQQRAQREADIARQALGAEFAQRGAFGGGRFGVQQARAAEALARQKGDIQAQGLQSAFQQAQQQFNTEQQARLAAQQANQQAGLMTGQQNLAALLGVQQLGAGQNLTAQQLNQAAQMQAQQQAEQARQYGYGQQMTAAQQAAQYGLAGQQAAEQSRQFGAGFGLQGLQQQLAAAQAQGQLGTTQANLAQQRLAAMLGAGATQRDIAQQGLASQYAQYQQELQYPQQMLALQQQMLQGLPISAMNATYTQPNDFLQFLSGAGGILGLLQKLKVV